MSGGRLTKQRCLSPNSADDDIIPLIKIPDRRWPHDGNFGVLYCRVRNGPHANSLTRRRQDLTDRQKGAQMIIIAAFIAIIGVYCFVNSVLNHAHFSRTDGTETTNCKDLVSIIIPARNEEKHIGKLLRSVIAQSYGNIEVFIVDDQSSDSTRKIIREFENTDSRIHCLSTDGSDAGTSKSGKIRALLQAVKCVSGRYILATDADCIMKKDCVLKAISVCQKYNYSMISGFPEESAPDFLTASAISSMMFSVAFVPHWLNIVPAAIGQFIFMSKEAYDRTGGYAALDSSVDDMALARLFAGKNERSGFIKASSLIMCTMYSSVRETYTGIIRSIAGIFKMNMPSLMIRLVGICLAIILALSPLISAVYAILGSMIPVKCLLIAGTLLFAAGWFISCKIAGFRNSVALTFPLSIAHAIVMVAESVYISVTGKKIVWKNREL